MTTIPFYKMHGLGNDFVIIPPEYATFDVQTFPFQTLAHRQLGIGCDQFLLLSPSTRADIQCRIFNADGSEAEQCGNGMRCIARFLHEQGLVHKAQIIIETRAGLTSAIIYDYDHIEVDLGKPDFDPATIGCPSATAHELYSLKEHGLATDSRVCLLSLGNPHAVLRVPSLANYPVATIGQQISTLSVFLKGVNVGFIEMIDARTLRLQTYERGAGLTAACGSNACASVIAGILHHGLESTVKVLLPYGELTVHWAGPDASVTMIGPAAMVFEGQLECSSPLPLVGEVDRRAGEGV